MTVSTNSEQLSDIADPALVADGVRRVEWAAREMPVIAEIRRRFAAEQPLRGVRISACLHVTSETANLMLALRDGGAETRLTASNPLSTQDDVAAALAIEYGITTYAIKGESTDTYKEHLQLSLQHDAQRTMDDGADLGALLHRDRRDLLPNVIGGTEETTTGVVRLRALAKQGELAYPIVAVNEANTKHLFDNRYGTGQSTLDGIIRATNILFAGKTVVVAGYGWCGRGIAMRARGLGAQVVVTEVQPLPALEAMTESRRMLRPFVEEYTLMDGRTLIVLAEGRLVNLAAAEGHPASVMDMSFANQALCAEYLANEHSKLKPAVYDVPQHIDDEIARLKLAAMDVHIATLTDEQARYLNSWEVGTT